MSQIAQYKKKSREEFWAILFSGFLFMIVAVSIFLAFDASGPVVLGTEMNTNGLVEYLCIGRGCETGNF